MRRAFTLVEVLLALGLLMLVLAAAYSALTLFQQVTVAGRKDSERSQIVRAIQHRIATDIRCVLFRQSEPEPVTEESETPGGMTILNQGVGAADDPGGTTAGSTSRSSSSSTESSGSMATGITDPADAYATQSVGVFGDATTLVLHVSKPSRPSIMPAATLSEMLTDTSASRNTDLRSISYFLSVAGAGGLQGAVGNLAAGGSTLMAREQGVQGLARLDGDRLAIQQADQAGEVAVMAQQATVLAPEVTELQFRYYDGTAWQTEWDTAAMNALPRAIEVMLRIDVDADEAAPATAFSPTVLSASDVYRFVVPLPLADPTQGMEL